MTLIPWICPNCGAEQESYYERTKLPACCECGMFTEWADIMPTITELPLAWLMPDEEDHDDDQWFDPLDH